MLTFAQIQHDGGITNELENVGFPAVLKYLRDRGIQSNLIDDLGFNILPASELFRKSGRAGSQDERLAVVIPHYNVAGDYIDWWSARLIDTGLRPVVHSFANLVPHKRGKMYCPPNEAPHAYLPPILDWRALSKGDRIYIHESAIKAINGARLGRWSIGLNGVWGWGSKKHQLALVPELKDLPWRSLELRPTIVFDSNAVDNWDVQAAISQLAARLLEITGRHADHILLPKHGSEHQGFDDFCVREGDARALEFLDGDGTPVEISGIQQLKTKLNAEVVVVRSMGRVAEQETGTVMNRATFVDVNFCHYVAEDDEGKWVNVPRLWLADSRRAEVENLTYAPGEPRLTQNSLNLWRGWGLEPSAGDVSKWLKVVAHGVTDPALQKWVLQWMAYPLQNPGVKLHSYIHLWGPPGSGKQALIYPLMRIYGTANAVVIGRGNVTSAFNSVYANKQFINVDEIHKAEGERGGDDVVNNTLKKIVTWPVMVVNTKGIPEYEVPNVAQVVTTSNYPDSIKLDDDDRRCAVIRFGARGENLPKPFWTEYFDWIDAEGAAAVYDYLLRLDLTGFNPKGDAPMTEDKLEMIRSTRNVGDQWVDGLWAEPSDMLPPIFEGRALFTTDELATICYSGDSSTITLGKKNALGIKLHAAGFSKREIKMAGKKIRVWVVRDRKSEWDADACRDHLRLFNFSVEKSS